MGGQRQVERLFQTGRQGRMAGVATLRRLDGSATKKGPEWGLLKHLQQRRKLKRQKNSQRPEKPQD
jgi:hypothetical protein